MFKCIKSVRELDLSDNYFFRDAYVGRLAGDCRALTSAVSFCKCVYVGVADRASVLWDVKIVRTLKHNERASYELLS